MSFISKEAVVIFLSQLSGLDESNVKESTLKNISLVE